MTNRVRFLIVPLLLAFPAAVAAKTHVAEWFDVRIAVQPNATLRIEEAIRFSFHGGRYSFVTREIPKQRLDRLFNLRAGMDGEPAAVEIDENRSRVRVVWRFDAEPDSTHVFALSYEVEGAVRQEPGRDRLIWRAIPERRDYEIRTGEIAVEYPRAEALSASDTGRSSYSVSRMRRKQGRSVSVEFRSGFVARAPLWQLAEAERATRRRDGFAIGAVAAILGLLIGGFELARRRASLAPNSEVPVPSMPIARDPGVPPAVAARLAAEPAGGTGVAGALGTLFDLASRGVLCIREGEARRFRGRSYRIERRDHSQRLLPFETAVMDLAFSGGSPTVDSFVSRLASSTPGISARVEEHMIARGLLSPERIRTRHRWLVATGFVTLAGGVLAVVGILLGVNIDSAASSSMAVLIGLGAATFLVGLAGLICGSAISRLSREGALAAGQSRSLREALVAIARLKTHAAPADFDRWLPAAIAFGLGQRWIKRFRGSGNPMPEWFVGCDSAGDYAFFDFVAVTSSSADAGASSGGDGGSGGGSSSAG